MAMTSTGRLVTDRRRARALRIAGLAISVIAIVIVLQAMDLGSALRVMGRADPLLLLVVLGVLTLQLLLRADRWRVLLPEREHGGPIPVLRVVPPLLAGYLGNAVLPARLGEPIRAALVARRERLDGLECFGTTIVERVIDTATLAIVAFLAAVAVGAPTWIVLVTGAAALAGAIGMVLLVAVGLTALVGFLGRIFRRGVRLEHATSVAGWTRAFAQGVDRGRPPHRLVTVMAISCVCWALDATVFWLAAQAIDVPMSLPGAVLVAAVTVLGTAVPSAPGFIGTFELAATSTAVALGIPAPEALAVAILAHVATVVPLAIAGAAATILMGTRLTHLSEQAAGAVGEQSTGRRHTTAEPGISTAPGGMTR